MEEKANILVVDDLADKRLAFREVLEDLGENLVLVGSGAEALRELLERDFAVIVLDVNMPDIDGIETAELIRKHGRTAHTPIIFVTAYADEMQTERGYELGAVDYILTPVVPAILRSKVRVFVDLYRAQRRAATAARAEAARAAAELARRRSEFIALASRELGASLNLDASMSRLLEVLVPALGGCGFVSFAAAEGQESLLYRQRRESVRRVENLGVLPPVVRRAVGEVRAGGYGLQVRVELSNGERWLTGMNFAHIVPLVIGERDVGVLVVGTAGPGTEPLDQRGLLEIATRAAIAFDNAQLYLSLEREMGRAKAAEEKLQEASKRKDEFLAMLSHELRNPLAPIVTAAQVLEKVAPHDTRITWVREVVQRQVTHLAGLVDDLLDVSRITQGKITLHREAVELTKVIDHGVEIVRPQLDAKRHSLELQAPEAPIWVFGDFARLSQIVSNVLHNAVKYTADGGRICIKVTTERGSVLVSVADNGMGIERHFLPHVFEVFTQGYRGLDRSQGGLGVGLAVVQRLVELHHGEVTIESPGPGLGTEVRITLPCISEVSHSMETTPAALPPRQEGKRILVVDDNTDAAESIAVLLRLEGHEVKTVADGMQALACLDVFAPHVAVIDIGLPGMSGYEVARHIRDEADEAPHLIALTGYGQAEDLDRSRDAGFDHHFVKPADLKTIKSAIESGPPRIEREGRRTSR